MTAETSGKLKIIVKRRPYYEVASAAGVSVATVSRIANGSAHVSEGLRDRVIRTAAKLGTDLSQGCRPKANVIAFLLCNGSIQNPFHPLVMAGVEANCASHNCGLLFFSLQYSASTPWKDIQLPEMLWRRDLVRAAVLAGSNSQNLLSLLSHKGMPFVVLGNNVFGDWQMDQYHGVYYDDIEGTHEEIRHLCGLGLRNIWFIGNCGIPWFARRFEAYRHAMEEAGLTPNLSDFRSAQEDDVGYLAAKSILHSGAKVTAIVAGDDRLARGVYQALKEKNLRIPEDVSVVGFDDIGASLLDPQLTTVRVFPDQIGMSMSELLLEAIGRPDIPPRRVVIPTQLVKRGSSGPAFSA